MPLPSAASRVLADSDVGKGSPIGLLVVLLLVVAVYFLYRSMNRHLRNVPGRFDKPGELDKPGEFAEPGEFDQPGEQEPSRQEPGTPDPATPEPGTPEFGMPEFGTPDRERQPDVPGDKSE